MRKICINKTHRSKTLHLLVEINNYIIEGLVDTRASLMNLENLDTRASKYSLPDAAVTLMLQQPSLRDTSSIPTLLQVVQMKDGDFSCSTTEL